MKNQSHAGALSSPKEIFNNDNFRLLVENITEYAIFMLDPGGVIISWNAGAERINGYREEEAIGRHFSIFYPKEDLHKPPYELEVARTSGMYREEGWRLRKNGTRFWASVTITALRDASGDLRGFGKVTRDMTDRRLADEELRASEERFRLMVESAVDYAICMLDPAGIVTTWNVGAERMKGYTAKEIIGRHFSVFYPDHDRAKAGNELQTALRNGVYRDEGWRVRKDGSRFWALVTLAALHNQEGQLRGFCKVTRDMTERKLADEALRAAYQDLEHRVQDRTRELQLYTEELARSNADLAQFAYIASHDLQEPLRMVSSYVDLLSEQMKGRLDPVAEKYLQIAQDGAVRAQQLIHDLLEYARIDRKTKATGVLPLAASVSRVLDTLALQIQELNADVTVGPLPELCFDPVQMDQVFQNLIANALKFRSPGKRPVISVSAEKKDGEWEVTVADNGIGIDSAYAESVFVLFKRLHSSREYPGTGIGLALCKKIIERHNGRIWVEPKPGGGSQFHFTIPEGGKA